MLEVILNTNKQVSALLFSGEKIMIKCPKCGVENKETSKFCSKCGAPLQKEAPKIPEDICKRRIVVYKPLVDPGVAKIAGENEKTKLFSRFGIFKRSPDEIQLVSFEKFYEPYMIVNGTYDIDYYREGAYTIEVADDVTEIVLFNNVIKPETSSHDGQKAKIVGEERIKYEDKAYLLLDKKGNELPLDQIPPAPSEENPEKILAGLKEKASKIETNPEEEVEIVRTKIVKRPKDIKKVISELFKVSERILVYVPMYHIVYRHPNTNEEKSIDINGITAKTVY